MIIGHQKQWQFLKKLVNTGKVPHALLFVGQAQLGKKTLAIEFIEKLFNDNIRERQHPDFIFVEPQKGEIQISQIREFIRKLSFKPLISPFKVAVIDQAHCMNQEAQNCLLKTLEEPKGKSILILITEYPEMLFPTILSRCEVIKFYPVKEIEIKKYLESKGISDEKMIRELTLFSMGRPGLAIDFISDPQKLENQRKAIEDLIRFSNSELSARFQYIKDISQNPQSLREILDIWLGYFRNILLAKATGKRFSSNVQFNNYSFLRIMNILKLLQKINFLIRRTNINSRLALEILAIEI